ncbi:MAG: DNA polymerase III subunit gamma/tau [Pirellulales bacterium]
MSRPLVEVDGAESDVQQRSGGAADRYVVVARRYRPQAFNDLVGQDTVSAALRNAIRGGRVGHAYLFTGARGVGKTSTARIFAKALNCQRGPTDQPCNECDICQGIAAGDDVDVLEIDGASNRGIDEIRQLRSNVSVRPSRARYKIYIIDEVHMLTKEAFNALLKTLEEPPEHVKFIFCTTDPERIPITVLSRCQRYDFPPVETSQILGRLREIAESEGATADPEALQLLARRAAGSMRDSQSLLEQVLALGGERITVELVHQMLGTAGIEHVERLVDALIDRHLPEVLQQLDRTLLSGVDAGQLSEQLLVYLRDLLVLAAGGSADLMLAVPPASADQATAQAKRWGFESMLAAVQVLDQAIVRMRRSIHPRVLLEVALVRVARLEDLDSLSDLIGRLQDGSPAGDTGGPKKKTELNRVPPPAATVPASTQSTTQPREPASQPLSGAPEGRPTPPAGPVTAGPVTAGPVTAGHAASSPNEPQPADDPPEVGSVRAAAWAWESIPQRWSEVTAELDGMLADCVGHAERVATCAPKKVVVTFPSRYNSSKMYCERPERRRELELAIERVAGHRASVEFGLSGEPERKVAPAAAAANTRQRQRELAAHPWVQSACQIFGAEVRELVLGAEPREEPSSGGRGAAGGAEGD